MDVVASVRAKFDSVLPHLDERQQRLVMAGEARSLGHGGIAAVANATGASRSRISQGVAELEAGVAPSGRVRRAGGGRKAATATDPALVAALLALVELLALLGRQAFLAALLDVGLTHPVRQAALADAEVLGDIRDRLLPQPGKLNRAAPELRRVWGCTDGLLSKASLASDPNPRVVNGVDLCCWG